jgi:hypothetical protein
MRKLIVVTGTANTGKTSSIRLFLANRGIHHAKRGDITAIIPITKKGRSLALAIGTGGDHLSVVKRNTDFFDEHGWDVVVCASKSRGAAYDHVIDFAKSSRAKLIEIPTIHVNRNRTSANQDIAAQIERALV